MVPSKEQDISRTCGTITGGFSLEKTLPTWSIVRDVVPLRKLTSILNQPIEMSLSNDGIFFYFTVVTYILFTGGATSGFWFHTSHVCDVTYEVWSGVHIYPFPFLVATVTYLSVRGLKHHWSQSLKVAKLHVLPDTSSSFFTNWMKNFRLSMSGSNQKQCTSVVCA